MFCRQLLMTGMIVVLSCGATSAEDLDVPPPPATPITIQPAEPPAPEQLQQWTRDLSSPVFAVRQAASQKLVQAGKAGMEQVAITAQTEDLELATRCLAVLAEGLISKAEDVRQAARGALEKLAASDNRSVARRARQALEAPPKLDGPGQPDVAQNVQQVQVQIINGVREIKVRENDKEVIIKDNNGKDISVTTTELKNGQKVTRTVTGKDEDDLKKNQPEAHAVFEKYRNGGNGMRVQIRMNAVMGQNIIVPGLQRAVMRPAMVPIAKAAELSDELDKIRKQLDDANGRLLKSAESDQPDPADLKTISAQIKQLTRRLGEIKQELEQK